MIDRLEHKKVIPPFVDRHLRCIDCNAEFLFSEGEARYFYDHNFDYPSRCPRCREARRNRGNHPLTDLDKTIAQAKSLFPNDSHKGVQQ